MTAPITPPLPVVPPVKSKAPTRKVTFATVAGAIVLALTTLVSLASSLHISPELASGLTVVVSLLTGYLTTEK